AIQRVGADFALAEVGLEARRLLRFREALVEVRRIEVGDDYAPWHLLKFVPAPHQQGSFRPILSRSAVTRCCVATAPPPPIAVETMAPPSPPRPAAAIASAPASNSSS